MVDDQLLQPIEIIKTIFQGLGDGSEERLRRVVPFQVEQPTQSLYPSPAGPLAEFAHVSVEDFRLSQECGFFRGRALMSILP